MDTYKSPPLWQSILALVLAPLPSSIKIPLYRRWFGYKIGTDVSIGLTWLCVGDLTIGDHVRIGHLNRFKGVPKVVVDDYVIIGSGNTFTSTIEFTAAASQAHRRNRPSLTIGRHCGITLFHYFDVQDAIEIGPYTVVAGRHSTFFTHYLDVLTNSQSARPIRIGAYCMVGSNANFTPGAAIADCTVVGMAAVVTKSWTQGYVVLGGNPARVVKTIPETAPFFSRTTGWIGTYGVSPFDAERSWSSE